MAHRYSASERANAISWKGGRSWQTTTNSGLWKSGSGPAAPTVRARFQNVSGPGEILGAGESRGTPHTIWRNVTPTFVYRALNGLPLQLDNVGLA